MRKLAELIVNNRKLFDGDLYRRQAIGTLPSCQPMWKSYKELTDYPSRRTAETRQGVDD